MTEPVADTVRSILDGHIVLSRSLAERNHYPAIDVLASVSRAMPAVVDKEHMRVAGAARAALAEYEGARDLIEVGAYAHGSNPAIDESIALRPALEGFLCQELEEQTDIVSARRALEECGVLDAHALLGAGAGLATARPTDGSGIGSPAQQPAQVQPQPAPGTASPLPSMLRGEGPR
jgi:hypothetical protein